MFRFSITFLISFLLVLFIFGCHLKNDVAFLPSPYNELRIGDSPQQIEQKLSMRLINLSDYNEGEFSDYMPEDDIHIAGYEWNLTISFHNNQLFGINISTVIIMDDCDDFIKHILPQLRISKKHVDPSKIERKDIINNNIDHLVMYQTITRSNKKHYEFLLLNSPQKKNSPSSASFTFKEIEDNWAQSLKDYYHYRFEEAGNSKEQTVSYRRFDSIRKLSQTYPKK